MKLSTRGVPVIVGSRRDNPSRLTSLVLGYYEAVRPKAAALRLAGKVVAGLDDALTGACRAASLNPTDPTTWA